MKFTVQSGGDFAVYEAGVYEAELASYEDAGMGQFGKPRVRLNWALVGEDGQAGTDTIPSWVSQVLSPNSTLYQVVCALTGVSKLEEGEQVDLDELLGSRCQISLTRVPRKEGDGERNNVAAYSPIRRRGPTKVATAARQPEAVPF